MANKKRLKMKAARVLADLTQEELARKVEVSRQTITMIENGAFNPTLNLAINICKALGTTLDAIFWED